MEIGKSFVDFLSCIIAKFGNNVITTMIYAYMAFKTEIG